MAKVQNHSVQLRKPRRPACLSYSPLARTDDPRVESVRGRSSAARTTWPACRLCVERVRLSNQVGGEWQRMADACPCSAGRQPMRPTAMLWRYQPHLAGTCCRCGGSVQLVYAGEGHSISRCRTAPGGWRMLVISRKSVTFGARSLASNRRCIKPLLSTTRLSSECTKKSIQHLYRTGPSSRECLHVTSYTPPR